MKQNMTACYLSSRLVSAGSGTAGSYSSCVMTSQPGEIKLPADTVSRANKLLGIVYLPGEVIPCSRACGREKLSPGSLSALLSAFSWQINRRSIHVVVQCNDPQAYVSFNSFVIKDRAGLSHLQLRKYDNSIVNYITDFFEIGICATL